MFRRQQNTEADSLHLKTLNNIIYPVNVELTWQSPAPTLHTGTAASRTTLEKNSPAYLYVLSLQ